MILCLDVGNSQVYGGILKDNDIVLRFRHSTDPSVSADQLGIFLINVIKENKIDPSEISAISICSVVPNFDYPLRHACVKYFDIKPFILKAGVKTGLKIKYRNPLEVGADRIANAIAALDMYPDQNRIIVDFGTATTFCAINKANEYLGGVIMPGFKLSMHALQSNTAKLSSVEIIKPEEAIGRSTQESLQIGIYQMQHATIRAVRDDINAEHFSDAPAKLVGTGGFAYLFADEGLFDVIEPDLVLYGLRDAYQKNC